MIELMIVVGIIGILATLAISSYSDYTARAQTVEAFSLLDGVKTPLTAAYVNEGLFLIGGASGIVAVTSGKYASIAVDGGGNTSVIATFNSTGVNSKINSKQVHLHYDVVTGAWTCANGDASADPAAGTTGNAATGANAIPVLILPNACQ